MLTRSNLPLSGCNPTGCHLIEKNDMLSYGEYKYLCNTI